MTGKNDTKGSHVLVFFLVVILALAAAACGKTAWADTEEGKRSIRTACRAAMEYQRESETDPDSLPLVFTWNSYEECVETTTETYRESDSGSGSAPSEGEVRCETSYIPTC